ncbi:MULTISPECIES: 4'-phosphopantetheinyl transferase superfamily protein [unclassified Variovorax]|uniref:4'-phosphopantetheinyl transferase family protein n=1 Tax=unclassified Variovorax TaxID=663243 RepID=UPI00257580F2|nr:MULTISPECIES: 4'-phosphopantetheinyl transferase superfamily protein [unclassified Variovorax]MDM0088163.1 4'-phosphopantetheinyl transferase superfamily protein [Variovorax sp. J22G40]MDM0146236.1 4'-phosphopantetheinyl transferase superfamily protein [Variovorax sp. J2P1-31]
MRLIVSSVVASTPEPCELWRFPLDQYLPAAAIATLSPDEIARARRFVFEKDRHHFMAARAALRQLLGQRTGLSPAALQFTAGPFGKPALADVPGLHFNLSHSGATGVLALSERLATGIDVELLRPMPDARALADAYFAPGERAAIAAIGDDDATVRDAAFLGCWTRKEACLKAVGIGLHLATAGFEVGTRADERTVEIATADGIERVWLQPLELGDGLVASLALRRGHGAAPGRRPASALASCG